MADVVLLADLIDFEYISSGRLENVSRVYSSDPSFSWAGFKVEMEEFIMQIRLSCGQVSRLKLQSDQSFLEFQLLKLQAPHPTILAVACWLRASA